MSGLTLLGGMMATAPLAPPVPAFDPATLSPDGWWRASYSGAPWTPTSPSAHGNLVAFGTAPGVGSAVNGLTPANWPPSSARALQSAQASSNFLGTTNCTLISFFQVGSVVADEVAWYSEALVVGDDGGSLGISVSLSGVRAGNGNGGSTSYLPLNTSVWAMAAMRISGGQIHMRLYKPTGHADATPVTSTGAGIGSLVQVGKNWNGVDILTGDILEILTWKATALSDADLDNIALDYGNAQYALGLT